MKILWVKRPTPDTYVHPSFLSQLKLNQNVVQYNYKTIVFDASVLLVNIDVGIIFLLSFVLIYEKKVDPLLFVAGASAPDTLLLSFYMSKLQGNARIQVAKSAMATLVAILSLTPVFRSLTESTSSDSIWALCGWLLLCNVATSSRSFPALTTNTALAAIIVLASRLETSLEVFYFTLFNIQSFVVLPYAYKWLKLEQGPGRGCVLLAVLVSFCSCLLMYATFGIKSVFLWILLQFLVLLGLPALFLKLHKYKDQISGPWDPANPDLN